MKLFKVLKLKKRLKKSIRSMRDWKLKHWIVLILVLLFCYNMFYLIKFRELPWLIKSIISFLGAAFTEAHVRA